MRSEPAGWDPPRLHYPFDLTTKFTVLYLVISPVIFVVLTIRFLPMLWRLSSSVALLRAQHAKSSHRDSQHNSGDSRATRRYNTARAPIQVALAEMRRWVQLTVLILLADSATEIADELRGISMYKLPGVSPLRDRSDRLIPCGWWRLGLSRFCGLRVRFSAIRWRAALMVEQSSCADPMASNGNRVPVRSGNRSRGTRRP